MTTRDGNSGLTGMPRRLIERSLGHVWNFGTRVRNRAKRSSLLGPMEPLLLKMAARFPAPNSQVTAQVPTGKLLLIPPGYPSARTYSAGLYEPEVTQALLSALKPGMVVLDAGANVGYYTLIAAGLVGPTGYVAAFEPDPLNYSYLLRNLERNSCSNAQAFPFALSHSSGSGRFVRDPGGAEGFLTPTVSADSLEVEVRTIDEQIAGLGWPRVDLVKIDVEGSEVGVLEGMRLTSARCPALRLIVEFNANALARSGRTPEQLARLFVELGFERYEVIETNGESVALSDGLPQTNATYNLSVRKR